MIRIKRKIWLPVIVWSALFLFVFNISYYFKDGQYAFINGAYEVLANCVVYYLTALFLFPRYYKTGRNYFWVSLSVMISISLLLAFVDYNFLSLYRSKPHTLMRPPVVFIYIRYFFSVGFTYFVATSINLMKHTQTLKETEKLLTKEKLETELKLLKAQINPHFIFNALNNIYSLTYMQSKKAPESVLKLSEMLRYVFYDCSKDRVPLSAELKYIENFTAFQQMKSAYRQNINLKTRIEEIGVEIAPMLFIPFIENAFKYSRVEEEEGANVNIEIRCKNRKIYFMSENSISQNRPAPGSKMGIQNVKHRLNIIYPNRHQLSIENKEESFKVELVLEDEK